MNTVEREDLARRAAELASSDPDRYQRTVSRYVGMGYAYIGGVVLLALIFVALMVFLVLNKGGLLAFVLLKLKLGIPLIIFVWFAFRSLASLPKPSPGIRLSEVEAPKLYAALRQVSDATQARMPDDVIISHEINASIRSYNRFWLFGERRELVVGGHLLLCLSKKQFMAVVAHEFAHFSEHLDSPHSKANRAIYTWGEIFTSIDESKHTGSFIYRKFLDWWYPRLHSWAMAGARQNEYEADALAAKLVSADAMAEALLNVRVRGQFVAEEAYESIFLKATRDNEPPENRTELLLASLENMPKAYYKTAAANLLKENTFFEDTHPCTRERIKALNVDVQTLRPKIRRRAVDSFLDGIDHPIFEQLDMVWRENVSEHWQQIGESRREYAEREQELAVKIDGGDASLDERLEHACFVRDSQGIDAAKPLFIAAYNADPEHGGACFMEGVRRINEDDESGVPLLRYAIDRFDGNWSRVFEGWQILFDFARRVDDRELLQDFESKLDSTQERYDRYQQERMAVHSTDVFGAHDIKPEVVDRLVKSVRDVPEISAVWLLKKEVSSYPEHPSYMIFTKRHPGAKQGEDYLRPLMQEVSTFNDESVAWLVQFDVDAVEDFKPWAQLEDPSSAELYRNDARTGRFKLAAIWTLFRYGFKGAFFGVLFGLIAFFCLIWLQSTFETGIGSVLLQTNYMLGMWVALPVIGTVTGIIIGIRSTRRRMQGA